MQKMQLCGVDSSILFPHSSVGPSHIPAPPPPLPPPPPPIPGINNKLLPPPPPPPIDPKVKQTNNIQTVGDFRPSLDELKAQLGKLKKVSREK